MTGSPSTQSRRAVLAAGTASLAALAGCSGFGARASEAPKLDRVVLRSDTGQTERIELTLVYAPRDGSTERPIRGVYEALASGKPKAVGEFDGAPGFYSLTAAVENRDAGVVSVNSYGNAVGSEDLQFEVVVREDGGVWTNVGTAGDAISVPGR